MSISSRLQTLFNSGKFAYRKENILRTNALLAVIKPIRDARASAPELMSA